MKKSIVALILISLCAFESRSQISYITTQKEKNNFPLFASGKATAIYLSTQDYPGCIRAAKDLQQDIERVTTVQPSFSTDKIQASDELIIIGTIGKSTLINELINKKKIDVTAISGKWESYLIQVVEKPLPNVKRALVIAGSDKRGTIFGIYDVSKQIGVSPWYWWADVPVRKSNSLYARPVRNVQPEPAVKYRGIFINDEQPALGGWVRENYGGFNHQFYEKVFELILRLKGNFLWPAMWGQSIYSDDPLSPKLADEYGIVLSTSHHEPMMRAHVEWQRAGGGEWNYATNEQKLREFWRDGIKRMGTNESIVTLAMRGDGDMAMSAETNTALLEKIVNDQRKIIAEVTGKDVTATPQVWALYKEVQDYYDNGMRVPEDVTLLLCDDNWGNIRKLPKMKDAPRKGGYGIYYHYDYVGGPRNYKWLNTNPITRVWEQMNLAYQYGANRIWIVNVGDIKPMEFPIDFFLDYAWDPTKWNQDNLDDFTKQWAAYQFGDQYAPEIARIISTYTKFNSRRKPELLSPETYSLVNYRESETIVKEYNQLAEDAENIYRNLSPQYKDAYFQLVLFPVKACANLNELHITTGHNRLYSQQGRASTNELADRVEDLFNKDAQLAHYYNKVMANGKWNHMMDQTHISYTYWQQPEKDVLPDLKRITLPEASDMGVAVEGTTLWWPNENTTAVLPSFDRYNQQQHYLEIFNRGITPFNYSITANVPWARVTPKEGRLEKEQRVEVTVDWNNVPAGTHSVLFVITGENGKKVNVNTTVYNPSEPKPDQLLGHVEANGYVSIESAHYTKALNSPSATWKLLPDLGRTLSAVTTFPVTAESDLPESDSPHLEYSIYLFNSGEIKITTFISPTIDFHNNGGLRYAISIDNEKPQIINIHPDTSNKAWEKSVADNIIESVSKHIVTKPGSHIVKFWRVDPAIALQKFLVETTGAKPSYLGPPESYYRLPKNQP
ncbi:MAG TPA: glycosyl hydrolase 115 family protein [Cyclobacteriaceae bacterium]|nr:glycosyl hydrolase 115 family protein [Cyclobacteriaceae bacterium]